MYLGDFAEDATVRVYFNTRQADGTPITLAGTPTAAVYKDASVTEITAGVGSISVDFDSRTGLHYFAIDTSASADYTTGSEYKVVLTAGTVDSISVVGVKVAEFSIQNRSALRPTVAGRTLDVSSGGEAGIDFANIGSPTTTVNLSGTTVKAVTDAVALPSSASINITGNITGNLSGSVGSVTGNVGGSVASVVGNVGGSVASVSGNVGGSVASVVGSVGSVAGNVGGSVGSVTGAVTVGTISANALNASALATDAVTEIATAVEVQLGLSGSDLDTTLNTMQGLLVGIDGNVTTLLGRITATLFNGITSLGDWIRRIARKDAGTAGMIAAEAEIDTGGTSTFTGTTDNLEAIKDSGGGGGGGGTVNITVEDRSITLG
jgi:hypothetical protein